MGCCFWHSQQKTAVNQRRESQKASPKRRQMSHHHFHRQCKEQRQWFRVFGFPPDGLGNAARHVWWSLMKWEMPDAPTLCSVQKGNHKLLLSRILHLFWVHGWKKSITYCSQQQVVGAAHVHEHPWCDSFHSTRVSRILQSDARSFAAPTAELICTGIPSICLLANFHSMQVCRVAAPLCSSVCISQFASWLII